MDNPRPRLLRPIPAPLGMYLRCGWNDHRVLLALLSEGHSSMFGVVFDPCFDSRQEELRVEIRRSGLDCVLDTGAMELATSGGVTERRSRLPWAGTTPHRPVDLSGGQGRMVADAIADYATEKAYTAVLAPAHYISGPQDPWLPVDRAPTMRLRQKLDLNHRSSVPIFYPLALPGKILRDPVQRAALKAVLRGLPIDALWLRVHPFGSSSGPSAVRGYIEACRDLHDLRLPIIGERTGTVGLALLAFGAVGGIESGVTIGENFNVSRLLRPNPNSEPFGPPPRVYVQSLALFLAGVRLRTCFAHDKLGHGARVRTRIVAATEPRT